MKKLRKDQVPRSRTRGRYPWQEWAQELRNGAEVLELEQGVDFFIPLKSVKGNMYKMAHGHGLRAWVADMRLFLELAPEKEGER